MGHYDEQREAARSEEQQWHRQRLYKKLMGTYFDKFFDVAEACHPQYVMLPIKDAQHLIEIAREQAVMDKLSENS